MHDTEVPDYLLELMSDKNKAISKFCIKTLDIIAVSISSATLQIQKYT